MRARAWPGATFHTPALGQRASDPEHTFHLGQTDLALNTCPSLQLLKRPQPKGECARPLNTAAWMRHGHLTQTEPIRFSFLGNTALEPKENQARVPEARSIICTCGSCGLEQQEDPVLHKKKGGLLLFTTDRFQFLAPVPSGGTVTLAPLFFVRCLWVLRICAPPPPWASLTWFVALFFQLKHPAQYRQRKQ